MIGTNLNLRTSFVDSETRRGTNFVKLLKNKLYIRTKFAQNDVYRI